MVSNLKYLITILLFILLLCSCSVVNRVGHELVDASENDTANDQQDKQLEKGSSAEAISCNEKTIYSVQKQLSDLHYSPGSLDGVMGKKTERAIKLYQYEHNLKPTGYLNEETLLKLGLVNEFQKCNEILNNVPEQNNKLVNDNVSEETNKAVNDNVSEEANKAVNDNVQSIPSTSPFSKIEMGMGRTQVTHLLGHPKDMGTYISGKAYIPFYYGTDISRIVYYYENQGRITFGSDDRVIYVEYDPYEDGWK